MNVQLDPYTRCNELQSMGMTIMTEALAMASFSSLHYWPVGNGLVNGYGRFSHSKSSHSSRWVFHHRLELHRPLSLRSYDHAITGFKESLLGFPSASSVNSSHLQISMVCTGLASPVEVSSLGHDTVCTVAVFASSYLWVRVFNILVEKGLLDQKLSRKLVHITSGLLYALAWPIFSSSPSSRFFALTIPLANILKLVVYGFGILKDRDLVKSISRGGTSIELLRGPLYYVLVLAVCTVFFWRDSPVGVVALAIMCGGDGIADIVGRRFGGVKLPYNPSKSWAGSGAMFVFGFSLSICFLYYYSSLGFYDLRWTSTAQIVSLISFLATLVESLPISILDDNMTVPAVSILLGATLLPSAVL